MSSNNETIEAHVIIVGTVQGVGFRAGARHIASDMSLSGAVRNVSDGSVELWVQGTKEEIETFLRRLEVESFGRIDEIITTYSQEKREYIGFQIVR